MASGASSNKPEGKPLVSQSTSDPASLSGHGKLGTTHPQYDAGRYSRFVSLMKLILPTVAILLLALAFLLPGFEEEPSAISFDYKDVGVSDQKLTMSNPRFLSSDDGNQQYVVTAQSATQEDLKSKKITLVKLQADITLKNGQWLSLTAPDGTLDPNSGILDLQGGIEIFSDNGNQIHAQSARVNLKEKTIHSPDGLKGHGPMGEIEADSLVADQLNGNMRFEGNVKMILYP